MCRNFCLGVLVGVCLAGMLPGLAPAAAPQPRVSANHIIDAVTGDRFVPRGVNWPSFEYACQQGWGYSNDGAGATTAAAMADWKINTVRIPLNQDCWLGDDGLPAPGAGGNLTPVGYRLAVADFVETLNQRGIVAVLDLHWTGPDGVVADGLRMMADSRSDDFWSSVAATFKGNHSVIFDLFNEPHSRGWNFTAHKYDFDLTWARWRSGGMDAPVENDLVPVAGYSGNTYRTLGMADLVAAVRGAGATQPIILGGREYANDLTGWLANRPDDGQLIAGFHNYAGQHCSTVACWQTEISPVAAVVPVITGEVGQTVCGAVDMPASHLGKYIDWADRQNIGYLAWAWWASNEPDCSANYDLISDLDGTPKAPVGTFFRDHLIEVSGHPVAPDPDPPGPVDPDPVGPGPGTGGTGRGEARLKITKPRFSRGRLAFRVKAVPKATGTVSVKVFAVNRKGVAKHKSARSRLKGGSAAFGFKVRSDFTPIRIEARYPGDQKLKADRAVRRIGA